MIKHRQFWHASRASPCRRRSSRRTDRKFRQTPAALSLAWASIASCARTACDDDDRLCSRCTIILGPGRLGSPAGRCWSRFKGFEFKDCRSEGICTSSDWLVEDKASLITVSLSRAAECRVVDQQRDPLKATRLDSRESKRPLALLLTMRAGSRVPPIGRRSSAAIPPSYGWGNSPMKWSRSRWSRVTDLHRTRADHRRRGRQGGMHLTCGC